MTFQAREIMSVCLKQPRASFSPQQRNMRHILTEFVDRPVLFVPAFAQIEWFTFFFWGLSVVIYFSSVCVCVCVLLSAVAQVAVGRDEWVGQGGAARWIIQVLPSRYLKVRAFLQSALTYITAGFASECVCVCVCVCWRVQTVLLVMHVQEKI